MTGGAIGLARMLRVIETDVETFQRLRKSLDGSIFGVCVTNCADGVFIVGKLLDVTTGARQMPDSFRRRRIVFSFVTERARKTRVRFV